MLRTTKSKFIMILLAGVFLLSLIPLTSFGASDAATTASIAISVFQDDGKTLITNFSSGSIAVKNSGFETLDQGIDYSISCSGGLYTISNLPCSDTNYVTFSMQQTTEKVTAIVTTKISNTPKAAKMIWSSDNNYTAAKSGIIQGLMVDDSGTVLTGATVKAYNKDTIYETTSVAVTGAYKLYAPAGSYTLVAEGKDVFSSTGTSIYPYCVVTSDYANTAQAIKVIAGQAVGPIADLNGKKPWSSMEYDSKLGLSGITISPTSNTISGIANKNTIVSVYNPWMNLVDFGNGEWGAPVMRIFVGSQKVTAKSATDKTGSFSIKLPYYAAGKRLIVAVTDSANNYYEDGTYNESAVGNMTAALTADSKATILTGVTLVLTEPTGVTTGNWNSNIKSVSVTSGSSITLLNDSQYSKATKGKIIINKGVLGNAQVYTVTAAAIGYNDLSVTQTIGASTTAAPSNITGTFTVKAGGGSVAGSAQFSTIGTAGSGNTLVYLVSSQSSIQVKLGNPLNGYTNLNEATDITGVSTTNKYIHVYEISSTRAVVKAKVITLTAAQIKN
jgi:hypothetical protein